MGIKFEDYTGNQENNFNYNPVNINVHVLNLGSYLNNAAQHIVCQPNTKSIKKVVTDGPYGYVKTNNDIYCFNKEGLGSKFPIDNMFNQFILNIYPIYEINYVKHSLDYSIHPVMIYQIPLNDLLEIPVEKIIPLNEFIIHSGIKTYQEYNFWSKYLQQTPAAFENNGDNNSNVIENSNGYINNKWNFDNNADIAYNKNLVEKYKSFLIKDKCECIIKNPLVNVIDNICSCKKYLAHTHCKICGGIINAILSNDKRG